MRVEVDPASMAGASSPYLGTLTLTGYRDAGGATVTNTQTFYINTKIIAYPNGGDFVVTTPGDITRGVPFDITVRAIDETDGTTQEEYEGGTLNLNLTSLYSPPDNLTPTEYQSAGLWVDGVITITGLIYTGGSGAQTPLLQVYDRATRYNGFLQTNVLVGAAGYDLSLNPNLTRGVAANLVIQGLDADGKTDTAYVPTTSCTISLVSTDVGDAILPVTTDNTGWVNGSKTVAVTVSGGAGVDAYAITVVDDTTGQESTVEGAIAANLVSRSHSTGEYYRGSAADVDLFTDDWDAAAPGRWATMKSDLLADFDADVAMSLGDSLQFGVGDTLTYVNMSGLIDAGYHKFVLDPTDKAKNIVSVKLRFHIESYETNNLVDAWSRYAYEEEFRIKFSESAATFLSGADLRGMAADLSFSMEYINNLNIAAGNSPGQASPQPIILDVPTSVITGMTGNTLYVWGVFSSTAAYDYINGFNRSTDGPPTAAAGSWSMEGQWGLATGSGLDIYYV
jgi:hypothetical protein